MFTFRLTFPCILIGQYLPTLEVRDFPNFIVINNYPSIRSIITTEGRQGVLFS